MEFLDLVKIGTKVKVNIDLSKDRLNSKTIDAIKQNSTCLVKDFRLTDGKGVGVVVQLSNGENEWFFENEIEILDEDGKVIQREEIPIKDYIFKNFINNLKYKPKNNIKELINPLNFFSWLIYSLRDVF